MTDKEKKAKAKQAKPTIIQELGAKVQEMPPRSIQALCQAKKGKSGSYLAVMDYLKSSMREPFDGTYRTDGNDRVVLGE